MIFFLVRVRRNIMLLVRMHVRSIKLLPRIGASTSVYHMVLLRLQDFHLVEQLWLLHNLLKLVPNEYGKIFCCAHHRFEVWYVLVQVFVIKRVHYCQLHVVLEVMDVHDHASVGIHWAFDCYQDNIIVSMSIWVITFSEYFFVFFIR